MDEEIPAGNPPQPRVTRRGLLQLFGAFAGGAGAAGAYAFAVEPSWLEVTRNDIPVPGLPASLEGLKIAHWTDLHIKGQTDLHENLLYALEKERPDILVLTGDMSAGQWRPGEFREFFSRVKSPGMEVVAALGNWDYWSGAMADGLPKEYKALGIRLLVDEGIRSKSGLEVYATDDASHQSNKRDAILKKAGEGGGHRLLLTHSPYILDEFEKGNRSWALALAGHTHGGQVYLGKITTWLPPGCGRFMKGFYKTPGGLAYVSRGLGMSILDVRFNCRPEMPLFTLTRG